MKSGEQHKLYKFRYVMVFYLVSGAIFFAFSLYSQKIFSNEKMRGMIDTNSKWKVPYSDVCKLQLVGEPVDSGKNYVKISFICKNGKSDNTLSLKVVENRTFKNVIETIGGINNFDSKIILDSQSNWVCRSNGNVLKFSEVINPTDQINCEEN